MSRVGEAMRRAAEGPASQTQGVGLLNEPPEGDVGTFASEAYPHERPVPPPPPVTASTPRPTVVPSKLTFEEEGPGEGRSYKRFAEGLFEKIVGDRRMPAVCREQYRRLAAVLHDAQATNRTQVVMVASAVANEGKTLTVANVALTLANSYRKRVLVIDADLRRPTLHKVFKIDASSGLTDSLGAAENKSIVVRQVTSRLALLPAGRPMADPMAGLISPRMRQLIEESRELFDWIIVDTPPLVLLPDANLLTSMVDAAVLVVKAESTSHALVKRAIDAIGRSRLLGVVLNSATVGPHGGGYDGYDYSAPGSEIVSP